MILQALKRIMRINKLQSYLSNRILLFLTLFLACFCWWYVLEHLTEIEPYFKEKNQRRLLAMREQSRTKEKVEWPLNRSLYTFSNDRNRAGSLTQRLLLKEKWCILKENARKEILSDVLQIWNERNRAGHFAQQLPSKRKKKMRKRKRKEMVTCAGGPSSCSNFKVWNLDVNFEFCSQKCRLSKVIQGKFSSLKFSILCLCFATKIKKETTGLFLKGMLWTLSLTSFRLFAGQKFFKV